MMGIRRISKQQYYKVIPFLFTFANAILGLFSIVKTVEGDFSTAAWAILFAAVMDTLDGRIARYLGTSGELGGELDSLCDAISFCLAPAVLLYSWYLHDFGHPGFFLSVLALFVCAGLYRLARFNIIDLDQSSFFLGLPTTVAALFFAMLMIYQEWVAESPLRFLLHKRVVVGLVACAAFLMISSIRFPAFKKTKKQKNSRLFVFVRFILLGSTILWCFAYEYPLTLLLIIAYIGGSLFFNGYLRAQKAFSQNRR